MTNKAFAIEVARNVIWVCNFLIIGLMATEAICGEAVELSV